MLCNLHARCTSLCDNKLHKTCTHWEMRRGKINKLMYIPTTPWAETARRAQGRVLMKCSGSGRQLDCQRWQKRGHCYWWLEYTGQGWSNAFRINPICLYILRSPPPPTATLTPSYLQTWFLFWSGGGSSLEGIAEGQCAMWRVLVVRRFGCSTWLMWGDRGAASGAPSMTAATRGPLC